MNKIPRSRSIRLWVLHASMNGLRLLLLETAREYHSLKEQCSPEEIALYEQIMKEEGTVRR